MYTVVRLASLHVPLLLVSFKGVGGVLGLQFPFWAVPQAALVLRHFDTAKNPVCSETWKVGKGLTAFEGVLIFRFRVKFSR